MLVTGAGSGIGQAVAAEALARVHASRRSTWIPPGPQTARSSCPPT